MVPALSSILSLLSQLNLPTPYASRKRTGYGVHGKLRCTKSTSCGRMARRTSASWTVSHPVAARGDRSHPDLGDDRVSYFSNTILRQVKCGQRHPSPGCPLVICVWRASVGALNVANICASRSHLTGRGKKRRRQNSADLRRCGQPLGSPFFSPFFFAHALHWFPKWGELCNQRSHLSSLAQIFTLYGGMGCFTVSEAIKCNITLSAHVTAHVRLVARISGGAAFKMGRTFQNWRDR